MVLDGGAARAQPGNEAITGTLHMLMLGQMGETVSGKTPALIDSSNFLLFGAGLPASVPEETGVGRSILTP
jgi:hypothetical protein